MKIEEIKLSQLIPYANNAKIHDEKAISAVAESIKQFGFVQPVVIDKNNEIVIGHCRVLASKKLNLETVPCVCVDELTEEEVKALRLADNKTNELSDWDFNILNNELVNIIDIDMLEFGFEETIKLTDEYGDEFSLPVGDKEPIQQMTFTLHDKQAELIKFAMENVKDNIKETFGNTNQNGNALYEVVREWAEQRK